MTNKVKWSIDNNASSINFKVGHIIISNIKGSFKTFDASIYTSERDFKTAEIELWIDTSSINTADENRDEQLKGHDFFDVATHPQITFSSSTIGESDEEGNHELWGVLTIKGISKPVKLNAKFEGIPKIPGAVEQVGFTITGKFIRSDWDLYGKSSFEKGGMMVSKEVKLACNIQLIKAYPKNLSMTLEPDAHAGFIKNAF